MVNSHELKALLDPACSYGWSNSSGTKRFAIVVILEEGITFMLAETLGIGLGDGGTDTYVTNIFYDPEDRDVERDNRKRMETSPLAKIPDDREYTQVYFVYNKKGEMIFERIASDLPKGMITAVRIPEHPTDALGISFMTPEKHITQVLNQESPSFESESFGLLPLRNMVGETSWTDPTIWFHIASSINQHFDEFIREGDRDELADFRASLVDALVYEVDVEKRCSAEGSMYLPSQAEFYRKALATTRSLHDGTDLCTTLIGLLLSLDGKERHGGVVFYGVCQQLDKILANHSFQFECDGMPGWTSTALMMQLQKEERRQFHREHPEQFGNTRA